MTTIANSLSNQIQEAKIILEKKNSIGNSDGLIANFALQNRPLVISWQVNCAEEKWISENKDLVKDGNFTALSNLGFSLFLNSSKPNEYSDLFKEGMKSLMAKDPFPEDHVSFPFFTKQFLGIVLGLKSSNYSEAMSWMKKEIIPKRKKFDFPDNLSKQLNFLIESIVIGSSAEITYDEINKLQTVEELSFVYWCGRRGHFKLYLDEEKIRKLKEEILESFVTINTTQMKEWCIPFVLSAVYECIYESVNSIVLDINHVSKILGNFESAMKRWVWTENKKWNIENEYDVQSILWLILRSVFDDTVYEDPTPKFGRGSSKVDVRIPSLNVVIEVKFVRDGTKFERIENEIKVDSIDYFQSAGYKNIIVFIYDNTSSVQEHADTINALKKLENIKDVIIVSKPSHIK